MAVLSLGGPLPAAELLQGEQQLDLLILGLQEASQQLAPGIQLLGHLLQQLCSPCLHTIVALSTPSMQC